MDIGRASEQLKIVLASFNYSNLDDDPALDGKNTTTEFLAREIFDRRRLAQAIRDGKLGDAARGIVSVSVTLKESHLAWGSYEGSV